MLARRKGRKAWVEGADEDMQAAAAMARGIELEGVGRGGRLGN